MNAMTDLEFGLSTTREELLLRRSLLFRLLRGFDFNAPAFHDEMITAPFLRGTGALIWTPRR